MNSAQAGLIGKLFAGVVVWLIAFVTGFLKTAYQAYVLGQMWEWFIVPAGLGLETLAFSVRVGVVLIFNLLLVSIAALISINSSKESTNAIGVVFTVQIIVVIVVTMAWIGAAIWAWLLF